MFYNLSRNQKFDIFIMVFIMLNMLTMAIEYDEMSETYKDALDAVNIAFLTIFTLECVIKLLGLRLYYFKEPWNVFDFVVVVVSLLSKLTNISYTFTYDVPTGNRIHYSNWKALRECIYPPSTR